MGAEEHMSEGGGTMGKGFKILLGAGAIGGLVAGAAGVLIIVGAVKAKRAAAAVKK
jgi:hypothetical protein